MATAGTGKLTRRSVDRRGSAATPADVGAALRDARERLGVSLGEVRDRTGIPWQYLEALEAMDLVALPDQRTVVTAARRYSEVVGLDPSEVCGTALRVWQDVHWAQAVQSGMPLPATPSPASSSPSFSSAGPPASDPLGTVTPESSRHAAATTGRVRRAKSAGSPNGAAGSRRSGGSRRDGSAGGGPERSKAPFPSSDSGGRGGLESFTKTAEVPGIAKGTGLSIHFADTGTIPATSRLHRGGRSAPRLLRISIVVAAVLLVIAGAGTVLHHYRPQWFKDLHLTHETAAGPQAAASSQRTGSSKSSRASSRSIVMLTSDPSDPTSASVTVRSDNYQVVVLAQDPCWVDATVPSSSNPVYENVMQAGQKQVLAPSGGQISVQFGASGVVVGVEVGGKTVPGWLFVPTDAPFTLNFTSAPGS